MIGTFLSHISSSKRYHFPVTDSVQLMLFRLFKWIKQ